MTRPGSFVASVVAIGLVTAGFTAGGPSAGAEPTAPVSDRHEITAVDLPAGLQPAGINNRGRIVARTVGPAQPRPSQVVVVEDGAVTATVGPWEQHVHPLCSPVGGCPYSGPQIPFVNDHGVVATVIDGHAALWDQGRLTDLDGDALGSWLFGLDDRGVALVLRFMPDHQELGLWRRGSFTPVHTFPNTDFVRARASERGHVIATVLSWAPVPGTRSAFVWFRGVTSDLGDLAPSDVNRRGQVVGLVRGPTPVDTRAVVWQDGELTGLEGLGGPRSAAVAVNDRGQVTGYSTYPAAPRRPPCCGTTVRSATSAPRREAPTSHAGSTGAARFSSTVSRRTSGSTGRCGTGDVSGCSRPATSPT